MRENRGLQALQTSLAVTCALFLAAAAAQAKDDYPSPVRVCVRGAGEGGFVSADVGDSVKDLQKTLDGKKVIDLVRDPREAEVVVIILGRGAEETGRETYHSHSSGHSYSSTRTKETVRVVRAVLKAGSYELEMFGIDNVWWGLAAKDLGKKVEKWVKDNYDQILSRRERH